MSWHLTWQDPVAWAIVGIVLVLVWRRRVGQAAENCGSCGETEDLPEVGRVSLKETRLAGRLRE
jgi:hypothetical protein